MAKKYIYIMFVLLSLFCFFPINVDSLSVGDNYYSVQNKLDKKNNKNSSSDYEDWMDDYNQTQDCDGNNSILGNINDEDSVAWLLQQIFNFIKVIGPILVVILSSIDFAKVIIKSDDESMGKAKKKLAMRLILALSLFLVPTIIQAFLDVFGLTSDATCGLR